MQEAISQLIQAVQQMPGVEANFDWNDPDLDELLSPQDLAWVQQQREKAHQERQPD